MSPGGQGEEIEGMRPLLNSADVARVLQVAESSAREIMRDPEMVTVRIGRRVRVREEDLQDYIMRHRQELPRLRMAK